MKPFPLRTRLFAEALGTMLLVTAVVGSGIMAERLSDGNAALALLANTLATSAALVVLITILGPLSGAHLNPAVSMVFLLRGELPRKEAAAYVLVQFAGGIIGTVLAHLMFDLVPIAVGLQQRRGFSQWLSEAVATFSLLLAILGGLRFRPKAVAALVALVIGSAYWFTASTSFANPAVTLARGFTQTFSGISLTDVPAFLAAQFLGALAATAMAFQLFPRKRRR